METIYVCLEVPPKGANHAQTVEGRAAAQNWDKLRVFAQELGVTPLDKFLGAAESGGPWFPAAEALATLRQLITRVSSNRKGVDNVRLLIRDLNSYENILSSAQARGSKFRFSKAVPVNTAK